MYDLLASTPSWIILCLFAFVPAIVAVALHALFRRWVPPDRLKPHHEVAGFLASVVGVLYAVVLGFLVISVWASFDIAQRNADAETNDVADLLHIAKHFPEPARSRARTALGKYALEVRDREWSMLAENQEDPAARDLMLQGIDVVAAMTAPGSANSAEVSRISSLRDEALAGFRSLSAHRRLRVLDAGSQVPPPLYFALTVGALIVIAFVFLFGVDNKTLQLVMTALVVGMIGLQLGVVFLFDRPFYGQFHVKPEAWDLLIRDINLNVYRAHASTLAPRTVLRRHSRVSAQ